ncbi:MAG TPA: glycosyltransferase [Bacteroidales bacterium]|nr:glycosyltransferase [Bacteroidales bacterium]HPO64578.1 glycosyltransferase [Bacteroidales bacterium]
MKLSVIIVNYNVKYFLEQCLYSVQRAIKDIAAEVLVVDNHSVDGSCAMVREKFPWVHLIANQENVGFSRANNQAIRIARGEYVLLLNPDTVVQEDTFVKCIEFMDAHPEGGALGVKMIDGKGHFLPESKRALPTPWVAFYKIFGLSRLFPKSRTFGRYHLTYLNPDQIHEVEILSGAFMFIRRKVLDEIGLLDETFFMYGEDIDLSYRIIQAGYKNYYFPHTSIIHYKGESTKKGSLNYVLVFYQAMIIFAQKHFAHDASYRYLTFFIRLAIYLRALLSLLKRIFMALFLPVMDILIIFAGYLFLKPLSESIKFEEGIHYPDFYLTLIVPSYILIWFLSMLFAGVYDRPYRLDKVVKGIGMGTIIILAIYALLPEGLRYSRMLIVSGALWSLLSLTLFRYLLHISRIKSFQLFNAKRKKVIIVGSKEEYERIRYLLIQTSVNVDIVGFVSNVACGNRDELGTIDQISDIVQIYSIDEIIFSGKDMSAQQIIHHMLHLKPSGLEYKIAPPEGMSVIGSNSINTAGDLYLVNINTIHMPTYRRLKRLFDMLTSSLLLLAYPFIFLFYRNKIQLLKNILNVLIGRRTWVGYWGLQTPSNDSIDQLPPLRKGILTPVDGIKKNDLSDDMKSKLNIFYAKDYKFANDFNILRKGLLYIDRVC